MERSGAVRRSNNAPMTLAPFLAVLAPGGGSDKIRPYREDRHDLYGDRAQGALGAEGDTAHAHRFNPSSQWLVVHFLAFLKPACRTERGGGGLVVRAACMTGGDFLHLRPVPALRPPLRYAAASMAVAGIKALGAP